MLLTFLKTKSSKETWAPLLHKENSQLALIGDDLYIAGFTCWFVTSSWLTQSYQSGPAPPSRRQAPAKHRANPGGPDSQCLPSLGWRQQAAYLLSSYVCQTLWLRPIPPSSSSHMTSLVLIGGFHWLPSVQMIVPESKNGFNFKSKFVFPPVPYGAH